MARTYCLGQFIIPISSSNPDMISEEAQLAFLQRGSRRIHVYRYPQIVLGDLPREASEHIGPLLGPIATCSAPVTDKEIPSTDQGLMRLRAFAVKNRLGSELRGCIFVRSENIRHVQSAFDVAGVELTPIWNYNPRMFFEIPQFVVQRGEESIHPEHLFASALQQCKTELRPHQRSALRFLRKNESSDTDLMSLWNDPLNAWLRRLFDPSTFPQLDDSNKSRGSILADDMGLGKTLTTLVYILATQDAAVEFHWLDWTNRSAATLIICPLATLTNWQNEIRLHFKKDAIPYLVFHGPERRHLNREDLQSATVVLTTYEMIGESGGNPQPDQHTIQSLNMFWFRIVLDEAHLIRNSNSQRYQSILDLKSNFVLCLTGTPVQNRLTDLQSLITLLHIAPWNEEQIWRRCLVPHINVGDSAAIKTLTRLMETVCLRRTKDVLLNLPRKIEKAIMVQMASPWEEMSHDLHQNFIRDFGRLRSSGEQWDPAEFFRRLMILRQFCNHPLFARSEMLHEPLWRWQDSGKIVHLVDNLMYFLRGVQGIERPKAVIFSSFVGFLQIIERALTDNGIALTWLTGALNVQRRDTNLHQFRTDPMCNVLLASLQAGGVGIDLRCAQNVYMMEPGWNPAIEAQAIDRLYRLGQIHPVYVYRYYVEGSLEVNIYQIQRRKDELAMLSVPSGGNDTYECAKLLMSELMG
ncbi:hypothetical protein PTTG_29311 [Puccinia triticina 1-1 BBBD Race 1]|uniref:Uncharacterized protein n=1 Tax=Puccinia triticina (isolate 1-1 / race 1 (BBBD)) TaxID=630390 RepID=A0A180G548_PUCT1|nr:hypothetical protein PTTG_29311 [Puccinia triticina 1-1 BBBD Race 1]